MKLSGYTYVKNSVLMDYPFVESIESHLNFCDEVVVVDASDKNDGTREKLLELKKRYSNLKIFDAKMNWKVANYGVYDGVLKQAAREKCTGEFLWQFDTDEVITPTDRAMLDNILPQAKNLTEIPILALPVVEYWGSFDKVRMDINPWKARISRNHPEITHGIPISHRQVKNGLVYAAPGTDGCDYIVKSQGIPVPAVNFCNEEINQMRIKGLSDESTRVDYEKWFNQSTFVLPTIYHMSWFSIKSKIEKYKEFWGGSWKSLYGDDRSNNMFFDTPWDKVTPEMIEQKARELRDCTGGHIFHSPWNGATTPHVVIQKKPPEIIMAWAKKHPL